jgi:hypothetical protein
MSREIESALVTSVPARSRSPEAVFLSEKLQTAFQKLRKLGRFKNNKQILAKRNDLAFVASEEPFVAQKLGQARPFQR